MPLRPFAKAALALLNVSAFVLAASGMAGAADNKTSYWPGPVLTAEAKSKFLCESVPDRIFVPSPSGSECVSYFVTSGNEDQSKAVFFFNGDMPPLANASEFAAHMERSQATIERLMQKYADKFHVRYVYVSRLGLQGSSGDHKKRSSPHETEVMYAATQMLMKQLGIDTIALSGQSRGSTISASLLTMRLPGVTCAALGSGAFNIVDLEYEHLSQGHPSVSKAVLAKQIYNPAAHVDSIDVNPDRRIFVLGDRRDTRAYYPQQLDFVNSLNAAGHHAVTLGITASDSEHHGAARYTIPTAGACLTGMSDDQIIRAVAHMQPKGDAPLTINAVRLDLDD